MNDEGPLNMLRIAPTVTRLLGVAAPETARHPPLVEGVETGAPPQ